MSQTILITGASSGVGRAAALELLRAGHTVYGSARRVESMAVIGSAGGRVLQLWTSPSRQTSSAPFKRSWKSSAGSTSSSTTPARDSTRRRGHAARGSSSPVRGQPVRAGTANPAGPAAHARSTLGTDPQRLLDGGEIAFPLGAWYHASKHALEGYSDALRQEVKRFGIDVVLIQPGITRTEFGDVTVRALREHSGRGAYRELAEALARNTETMYGQNSRASDPTVVAKAIRKAVESRDPSTAEEHKAQTQVTTNGYRPDFPVCGSTSRRGTGSFPFLCGRGTARTR